MMQITQRCSAVCRLQTRVNIVSAPLAYFQHEINKAETCLKLFQAVSVFCFSFILVCATSLKMIGKGFVLFKRPSSLVP